MKIGGFSLTGSDAEEIGWWNKYQR